MLRSEIRRNLCRKNTSINNYHMNREQYLLSGETRFVARIDNASHDFIPGQLVNIRMLVNTLTDVVLVPATAIQIDNAGSRVVFVVKSDHTVERRAVTTGVSDNTNVVITRGLAAGEQVVVDNLARLQNGTRVIARGASAPQPPSTSTAK